MSHRSFRDVLCSLERDDLPHPFSEYVQLANLHCLDTLLVAKPAVVNDHNVRRDTTHTTTKCVSTLPEAWYGPTSTMLFSFLSAHLRSRHTLVFVKHDCWEYPFCNHIQCKSFQFSSLMSNFSSTQSHVVEVMSMVVLHMSATSALNCTLCFSILR